MATVSTKGILPQFDFFDPNREINKRLESYVEKHGPPEGLEELWLEQKLDHFTPSDTEVFSQVKLITIRSKERKLYPLFNHSVGLNRNPDFNTQMLSVRLDLRSRII